MLIKTLHTDDLYIYIYHISSNSNRSYYWFPVLTYCGYKTREQAKQGWLLLNSAKQTHQKQQKLVVKNFRQNSLDVGMNIYKKDGNKAEMKNTQEDYHASVACLCNRCRVVWVSFSFAPCFHSRVVFLCAFRFCLVPILFIGLSLAISKEVLQKCFTLSIIPK